LPLLLLLWSQPRARQHLQLLAQAAARRGAPQQAPAASSSCLSGQTPEQVTRGLAGLDRGWIPLPDDSGSGEGGGGEGRGGEGRGGAAPHTHTPPPRPWGREPACATSHAQPRPGKQARHGSPPHPPTPPPNAPPALPPPRPGPAAAAAALVPGPAAAVWLRPARGPGPLPAAAGAPAQLRAVPLVPGPGSRAAPEQGGGRTATGLCLVRGRGRGGCGAVVCAGPADGRTPAGGRQARGPGAWRRGLVVPRRHHPALRVDLSCVGWRAL
jgi:hypothetical protein